MEIPEKLLQSLNGLPGFDRNAFMEAHVRRDTITSVRLNPLKPSSIEHWPEGTSKVPWCTFGYYLPSRPAFVFDPLLHAGCYYVQEASSMFLEQALHQTATISTPLKVLDLCAAPGGKSTLLQSVLSKESLLVSNEVIKSRASILEENIVKWGAPNVIITHNDPKDFARLENYFDVIVIDAPCSGSGLFRREPEAIKEWSEENVQHCSLRQQRILADAWPALKQDGILIYSTCSYSKAENEEVLDWMAESFYVHPLPLSIQSNWGITETFSPKRHLPGYRFYPDKIKGEGLFMAVLQKKEGGDFFYPKIKKPAIGFLSNKETAIAREWINSTEAIAFFKHNDLIHAFPENLRDDLLLLQSSLYIKRAGVLAGQQTSKELIPDHELAVNTIIHPSVPSVELSRAQAVDYLRKEEIRIETSHRGWALAKYENQNLGWMKVLPNRINNYYPKAWRILKQASTLNP